MPEPSHAISAPPCLLVLDTNVWLDLLLFEDPRSAALAAALRTGKALALMDAACRDEWQRVLTYPALRVPSPEQQALLQRFDALTLAIDEQTHDISGPDLRCRDPDDQKFLALAYRGRAHALLSRDQALLELAARARRQGLFDICSPEQWRPPLPRE